MAISGFPALDRTTTAAVLLRSRLTELTRQTASGQRSESYAGLGSDARRAIDLRSEIARHASLSRAAEQGQARATMTQTALKRMVTIATEFAGTANGMLGSNTANSGRLAQSARSALQEVAGLLNERYAGESLFGGNDLSGSPIPGDIAQSGLFTGVRDALRGMGDGDGPALRETIRQLGASNDPAITPFSTHATAAATGAIEDARRSVPTDNGLTVEIGLYANRNAAAAPSTSPDSTGSWSRDLLYGLSVLANLGPDQAAHEADFDQVLRGAVGALRAGLDSVAEEAGALGTTENRLDGLRVRHEDVSTQLSLQLSSIEEVDLAEAISLAQATQTQLEASYRSLAMLGNLSLTKFIS